MFRRRRSVVFLLGVVLLVCATCSTRSLPVTANGGAEYYRDHKQQFSRLTDLLRSGDLGRPSDWSYYGKKLPGDLCDLAADCRVAAIRSESGKTALFLAAWIGIPDDAAGWGYFDGSPDGGPFDGFGMLICPVVEAGGGWWWLDRPESTPGHAPTCTHVPSPGQATS